MREVTTADFRTIVLDAAGPVLVDFWGPRCQPCLALAPAVERLAEAYAGRVTVVALNANTHPRVCIAHKVLGLPTFILFDGGRERARLVGADVTITALEGLLSDVVP
ncbi:MAG: thioredoxin family protein [Armatimonadota bacterium]